MYLKRKIDLYLQKWKNDPEHKPLIVRGARQVGKTEAIRHFARENYNNIVEINFFEEPIYKTVIEDGYKPESIINRITRVDPGKHMIPGKTLIFFDEIQE